MPAKLNNVVVATALTESSDAVVRAGLQLARDADAKLHLVHAYPVPMVFGGLAYDAPTVQPEILSNEASYRQKLLDDQLARVGVAESRLASTVVELDVAHRLVLEVAASVEADLLVAGASEHSGAVRLLLGSTADRILRKAQCPVLLVREPFTIPPREVLAPVDLSPLSEDSLRIGLELLDALDAEPPLIRALFVVSLTEREGSVHFSGEQIDRFAREELDAFLERVDPAKSHRLEAALRCGLPRHEVENDIEEHPVDLVIVGTHGRSGFERFLLGSVAAGIVHHVPSSVLVIPPRQIEEAS